MGPISTSSRLVPEQASDPTQPRGTEVLVVDDDAAMADTVVEILGLRGVTAVAVTSPNAAIPRERELHPAVVLCDQRLPDISGLELCSAIRAIDPDVSLILLTGHASLDTAIAAVGQIDQFLTKPLAPEQLVSAVLTGIDRSRTRRSERLAAEKLRRQLEAELRHQALHDPLTGLPNRSLFVERAQHALSRRSPMPTVICFLDLDDFKDVNDSLGHQAGDELLRVVGLRLTDCLRPEDTVARFGGDEFAILLENTDVAAAVEIIERIRAALRLPVGLGEQEVAVEASVGLAAAAVAERRTSEQLLAEADAAMYAAKARGRHCFEIFNPRLREANEARARIRVEIDTALVHQEFRLCYQPIMDLSSGARLGVEALIRWEHHERGLLVPADFVGQAESSGQIIAIGRWVVEHACRTMASEPDSHLSINMSPRELQQPDLVEAVEAALERTGFAGERLIVEITETAAIDDLHRTLDQLHALKALGLSLALDDFGTGYSSLSYLREFPVDYLKIDRSFVGGLGVNEAGRAIVQGVVDIAHALGIRTIAEGIERPEQLDILRELGCNFGQGHLWAPPIPLDQLRNWASKPVLLPS